METEKKEKKEMRAAYPYLGSCVGCPLGQKIKIKRSEQATSAFPSAASAARFLALSLAMHTHIYIFMTPSPESSVHQGCILSTCAWSVVNGSQTA